MKPEIYEVPVPAASQIAKRLPDADFYDSFELVRESGSLSALELYLDVVAKTPAWVNRLMDLRNRMVSLVGLKNLGGLGTLRTAKPASAYRVGDRVGIFSLLYLSDEEIILGDADKHLTVQVSVCKLQRDGRARVAVSTVVHINNLLGHVYMAFVAPLHKRIVPAVLSRI